MRALSRALPRSAKRFVQRWLPSGCYSQSTWSQCGEDRILAHLLGYLIRGRSIEYVDIGASHPFHFSNTALLYKRGAKGVLVEPNPTLASVLRARRPRDLILQCGVGAAETEFADYYMYDAHTLNTFSAEEASRYREMGLDPMRVARVELRNVNEILGLIQRVDLLNMDIEGMDYEVLQGIDWESFRPTAVCLETLQFEAVKEPKKQEVILKFMKEAGYRCYADTFVNTIFVDNMQWQMRFSTSPSTS